MFDAASRYADLKTLIYTRPSDGRQIPYVARRIPAPSTSAGGMAETTVRHGERADLVTARTLGNPELFWRICDANEIQNPFDMPDRAGQRLLVPLV
jgi:hypothetical protein